MLIGYRLLLICEGEMFLNIQVWEPYLFTFCKRCLVENLQETACGGSVSSTDGGVSQDTPLLLLSQPGFENFVQFMHIEWFRHVFIHASVLRELYVLGESVCGHRDDGHMPPRTG